ncbi:MAG: antibiotic biosynthesis monooxygenase [Bacteroidetes bacterium]|nr:antibiotic biosynthesis monooxygenase [Bacteroidota bacterium]
MIIRIVKMTFQPDKNEQFRAVFSEVQAKIERFPGCSGVELLQDRANNAVFMTFSTWDNEEALEKYRQSSLFKDTWQKTKVLFAAPAEAWSLDRLLI